MPDSEKLLKKCNLFLNNEISDSYYRLLVELGPDLGDSVEEQIGRFANNERLYYSKGTDSIQGFILNSLGHISANPSNKQKREIIENTYVHYNSDSTEINKAIPNYNKQSVKFFIDALIRRSRRENEIYLQNKDLTRDIFILKGKRGIGKTYFLNYAFTKYNQYLNNNRTIWIRINLGEVFGDSIPDIAHWLRSKIVLVMFKYYLCHPDFEDLLSDIEQYINQKPKLLQYNLLENFEDIKEQFVNKKAPELLCHTTVNKMLAKQIMHSVLERGYSFIYILDGFDRVGLTPAFKSQFDNICSQLGKLFDPDTKLGGCYLIVSREETVHFLTVSNFWASSAHRNDIIKSLECVNFEEIYEKRIKYLQETVPKLSKKLNTEQIYDIKIHLAEFYDYLLLISNLKRFGQFVQKIDSFYGSNHRAKVQLLQLCYHNFLQGEYTYKRYLLTEQMTMGGYKYPPKIFFYSNNENCLLPEVELKIFDNVFLPVIFRFPYNNEHEWGIAPHCGTYFIAVLRIVQILYAYAQVDDQIDPPFEIPGNILIKSLNQLFKYDSQICYLILEEMIQSGLLFLKEGTISSGYAFEYFLIETTPKLDTLYGFTEFTFSNSFVLSVAYLNLCAMRVPLRRHSIMKCCTYPFFKALSSEDSDLSTWTCYKIINAINLIRLVRKAIEIEDRYISKKLKKKLSSDVKEIAKLISFKAFNTRGVEENIMGQIRGIISKMNEKTKEKLELLISKYLSLTELPNHTP
jgi:hypothetical protein